VLQRGPVKVVDQLAGGRIVAETIGRGFADVVRNVGSVPHDLWQVSAFARRFSVVGASSKAYSWAHSCGSAGYICRWLLERCLPDVHTGSSETVSSLNETDLGTILRGSSLTGQQPNHITLTKSNHSRCETSGSSSDDKVIAEEVNMATMTCCSGLPRLTTRQSAQHLSWG